MCVQYCGVFSTMGDIMSTVREHLEYRGVFSTMGDIMINVGYILSTVGCSVPWGVQYRGGYHEYRGGYLEYCGGFQYCGGYHDACVGDIMSTVGGKSYVI